MEASWHLLNVLKEEVRRSTFHYLIAHTSNKELIENLREISHNLINGTFPLKGPDKIFVEKKRKKIEYIANKKIVKKKLLEFLTKNHSLIRRVLEITLPLLQEFIPKLT